MILVKFSKDWADEFTVYGFKFFENQEAVDLYMSNLPKSYSFGSNQGWEDSEFDSYDFEVIPMFKSTAETFISYFGKEWGIFPEE